MGVGNRRGSVRELHRSNKNQAQEARQQKTMAADRAQNLQEHFLNHVVKQHASDDLLVNGVS